MFKSWLTRSKAMQFRAAEGQDYVFLAPLRLCENKRIIIISKFVDSN